MEMLFIELVGPLIRNKRGHIGILVVVDSFSKFVSFCPVRKMKSSAVSDYLARSCFPVLGVPKSIVSYNALVFCCKVFKDHVLSGGFEQLTTTPYYPQASLAQRVNRNLKAALKIFTTSLRIRGMRICLG